MAVFAATGWLYVLRSVGALDIGPHVAGALPLEQLSGTDDQPFARLVAAWLPAGWLAAGALSAGTRLGAAARLLGVAAVAAGTLVLGGAVSDAAAISESIPSHLPAQAGRAGTWVAVALMLSAAWLSSRRRAPIAAPSGR